MLASRFVENENSQDPKLFEGDMELTAEQRHHAENGEDVDSDRKRGSIRNNLWPNGVLVYQIDSSISKFFVYSINLKSNEFLKITLQLTN